MISLSSTTFIRHLGLGEPISISGEEQRRLVALSRQPLGPRPSRADRPAHTAWIEHPDAVDTVRRSVIMLAWSIVVRRTRHSDDLAVVCSAVAPAIQRAIELYDTAQGFALSTYVGRAIENAITNALLQCSRDRDRQTVELDVERDAVAEESDPLARIEAAELLGSISDPRAAVALGVVRGFMPRQLSVADTSGQVHLAAVFGVATQTIGRLVERAVVAARTAAGDLPPIAVRRRVGFARLALCEQIATSDVAGAQQLYEAAIDSISWPSAERAITSSPILVPANVIGAAVTDHLMTDASVAQRLALPEFQVRETVRAWRRSGAQHDVASDAFAARLVAAPKAEAVQLRNEWRAATSVIQPELELAA